jgi:hypothetical protein
VADSTDPSRKEMNSKHLMHWRAIDQCWDSLQHSTPGRMNWLTEGVGEKIKKGSWIASSI